MRTILMLAMAFATFRAGAIECGPSMHVVTLDNYQEAVRAANEKVSGHSTALLTEQVMLQDNASLFDKIQAEIGYLDMAIQAGDRAAATLNTAWILALVRNQMIDKRDREIAARFLSLTLKHSHEVAQSAFNSTNNVLRRLTRPGIAVDVAGLRDAIETVAKDLSKCSPPERRK